MPAPPSLDIYPPLINTPCPWATSLEDLQALYECSSTGAVTTRTSLVKGFAHDPAKHQYVLFDIATHESDSGHGNASLNSLGYSPFPLATYLGFIKTIAQGPSATAKKGFIVSVTGSPPDIVECYKLVSSAQQDFPFPLAMEINLSCPNITGIPPPAYDGVALLLYLTTLQDALASADSSLTRIPFGIKTPPYTHSTEFGTLIGALKACAARDAEGICPVSFITATNTLGSSLVLNFAEGGDEEVISEALPGVGTGGLAGAPLHPLSLGNVATIRKMLDVDQKALGHIQIIGVGGVLDFKGYRRMRKVGAVVAGLATGLGLKGVGIFGEIEKGLEGKW